MNVKVRYQREMKHNYLIIEPDNKGQDSYEIHMLAGNIIEGLLRMHIKYLEEGLLYYYEITSKQPLSRLLESRGMKADELKKLIAGISAVLDRIESYLLREESIWLEAEYIYIEPDSYDIYFCLVPGMKNDFPRDMGKLLQFLLGKIDHRDKEGVVLAYGLFQESQKENYGIKNLVKILCGTEKKGEEKEKTEEDKKIFAPESPKEEDKENIEEKKKGAENKESQIIFITIIFIAVSGTFCALFFLMKLIGKGNYSLQAGIVSAAAVFIILFVKGTAAREEGAEISDRTAAKKAVDKKAADRKNEEFWMMELEEENELDNSEKEKEKEDFGNRFGAPSNDTILLADLKTKTENRRLVSLDKTGEEIKLLYYPFLIGKQEGMVDYAINCDTVSRMHLRIDEEEGKYRVTDLNSTNGTTVKGHLLEANESMEITPGDDLYIADRGFLFL